MSELARLIAQVLRTWKVEAFDLDKVASEVAEAIRSVDRRAPEAERPDIAAAIHYPDCWDTAAYPKLSDALHEVYHDFECATCKPQAQAEPKDFPVDEVLEIVAGYGPDSTDINETYRIPIILANEVRRLRDAYTGAMEDKRMYRKRWQELEQKTRSSEPAEGQEPVAWRIYIEDSAGPEFDRYDYTDDKTEAASDKAYQPLYAQPQRPAEKAQKPSAYRVEGKSGVCLVFDLNDLDTRGCIITELFDKPQRPAVPDAKPLPDIYLAEYHEAVGWNACREAMLTAAPAPERPAVYDEAAIQRALDAPVADGETIYWHIVFGLNNDSDEVRAIMAREIIRTALLASGHTAMPKEWIESAKHIIYVYDRAKETNNEFGEKAAFASAIGLLRTATKEQPNAQG